MLSHPSTHVECERNEHMRSRLQAHQQTHQEGLVLCHGVTLDSVAHRWVPARTPTVHRCPNREAVGGPQQPPRRRPQTNDNKTPIPPRQARRQRGTKPGQQRRPHSAERLCTATCKEETSLSRKTRSRTIQKRGNGHPRVMQERSFKNNTRNRSRPQCMTLRSRLTKTRENVMNTREGK